MSPAMAQTNQQHRGALNAQRIRVTVDRAMAFLRIVRDAATPFAIPVPRTYIENIFLSQCNIRREKRLISYKNSILGVVFLQFAHPGSNLMRLLVTLCGKPPQRTAQVGHFASPIARISGGMGPLGPPPVSSLASLRS